MTKKIELLAPVTIAKFPTIVENPGSRPAEEWRKEAATEFMGEILMVADIDAKPNSKVKVAGKNQPRFEVEIAEVERRVFVMTAKERAGNGKMTELAARRIGMFGKIEEDVSGVIVDAMKANEAAAAKADEQVVEAEAEDA